MSEEAFFVFTVIYMSIYLFVMALYTRKHGNSGERTIFGIIFGIFLLLLMILGVAVVSELFGI